MFDEKPRTLEADGVKVPIDPDFRIMCEYAAAIEKKDEEALREIIGRFYYAGISQGISANAAVMAVNDFYTAGFIRDERKRKQITRKDGNEEKKELPVFDFATDEAYFYGAFLSVYGIDLNRAKLHWYDFCALFRALPDDCRLKQIIGIRAAETSKIKSPEERARIKRLKRIYSLENDRDTTADALREMILKQRKEAGMNEKRH